MGAACAAFDARTAWTLIGRLKPLNATSPRVVEQQSLAEAKLGDRIRYETLCRLGVRTKPCGELDGGPEQILVILDRFSRGRANAHLDANILVCLTVFEQFALDARRAAYRRNGRQEARHDAVTPAHATSASSDMSPEHACSPLPPVAG